MIILKNRNFGQKNQDYFQKSNFWSNLIEILPSAILRCHTFIFASKNDQAIIINIMVTVYKVVKRSWYNKEPKINQFFFESN